MSTFLISVLVMYLYPSFIVTEAACSFPDELVGIWHSAHKGPLTLNSTTLAGYPIYMAYNVLSLDFECEENSNRKYMLRSIQTALIFGSYVRGYICIELWRVSATKYYYYHGTSISSTNGDNVYGASIGDTPTMDDVCSLPTPYDVTAYVTLVKDGTVETGQSEATCKFKLLAKFSNVTITDYTGTSTCSGNVVDGCSDKTKLSVNYHTSCNTNLKYSVSGLWTCLRSVFSGGYTFISLWNNDTSVSDTHLNNDLQIGTTYRFACLVVDDLSATLYPRYCSDSSQTSTSVPSPGLTISFSERFSVCYNSIEHATYGIFYAIIVIGPLFVIFSVICTTLFYKKRKYIAHKCRKKSSKSLVKKLPRLKILLQPPEKIYPFYVEEKKDKISSFDFSV